MCENIDSIRKGGKPIVTASDLEPMGLSPRLHRVTFPDSGQNGGGKSHFSKAMAPGDVKYKRMRKQL